MTRRGRRTPRRRRKATCGYATEYVDAVCAWKGTVSTVDQALGWYLRGNVLDKWGRLIDMDEIPTQVKNAVAEVAAQGAIAQTGEQMIKEETVGPITTVYETAQDRTVGASLYSWRSPWSRA